MLIDSDQVNIDTNWMWKWKYKEKEEEKGGGALGGTWLGSYRTITPRVTIGPPVHSSPALDLNDYVETWCR